MSQVSAWLGPPQRSTKIQDFLEATALPEASVLSLPKTKPGVVRLTAPAAAACSILRLEIFDSFIPVFRSYRGIHG